MKSNITETLKKDIQTALTKKNISIQYKVWEDEDARELGEPMLLKAPQNLYQAMEEMPFYDFGGCAEIVIVNDDESCIYHLESAKEYFESSTLIDELGMEPSLFVLCDAAEIEDKILEDYHNDNVEFNSLFCDFNVKLKARELLELYADIIHEINGDWVIRLDSFLYDKSVEKITVTGHEAKDLIPEGMYEDIYEGNYKDFLKSFNGKELSTGFFRFMDLEENEEGAISGEPLDFIW